MNDEYIDWEDRGWLKAYTPEEIQAWIDAGVDTESKRAAYYQEYGGSPLSPENRLNINKNIIHFEEFRENRAQINEQCKKMLQQALVNIIKLQIVSEDFLPNELPIGQLRVMEEKVTAILEQCEEWE